MSTKLVEGSDSRSAQPGAAERIVRDYPRESTYRTLTVGNGPFGYCQLGKQDGSTGGGERGTRLIGEKGLTSALLANLYSHYVLDQWVDAWRKRQAKSDVIVVRYADDLVLGFERRDDAEQFLKQFGERLAKPGLELHLDKTQRIVESRGAASSYGAKRRANGCEPSCSRRPAAHQQNISCIFPFFTSSGKHTATMFDDDSIRSRSGGRAEAVKC